MNSNKNDDITIWVQNILYQWNPIGIKNCPIDEYDSYASKVVSLLKDGAKAEKLSKHLLRLEKISMGLQGDDSRCEHFGNLLCEGFSSQNYLQ